VVANSSGDSQYNWKEGGPRLGKKRRRWRWAPIRREGVAELKEGRLDVKEGTVEGQVDVEDGRTSMLIELFTFAPAQLGKPGQGGIQDQWANGRIHTEPRMCLRWVVTD
jgi:hypothetical protein